MYVSCSPARLIVLCTFVCLRLFVAAQAPTLSELVEKEHQNGREFIDFQPFTLTKAPADLNTSLVSRADYLHLDFDVLHAIRKFAPGTITLALPFQGNFIYLELVRQQVVSEDFKVRTSDAPDQAQTIDPGLHYRGTIRDVAGSLAAISFSDAEIMGVIAHPVYGNLNLGRLDFFKNRTEYVLFAEKDFTRNLYDDCHTTEVDAVLNQAISEGVQDRNVSGCVRMFFEADNGLYVNKVTVNATVNYITGFFNIVSTLYQNETISIVISEIYVWTTPDAYPTTSSLDALESFADTRTSFNGDLAHLVALDPGGLGGIAYVDVLCSTGSNYAYSDINASYSNYPTYSWTTMVVTHEIGHNLKSNHTHWCGWVGGALDNCYTPEGSCSSGPPPTNGGTIMSYCHLTSSGINLTNGFGTQPGDAVRNGVSTASCLSAACAVNSCGNPLNFTLTGVTTSSATFSWSAGSNNTSYKLRYAAYPNGTFNEINSVSSPYTLNGLSAGQRYLVQLQGTCASGASGWFAGVILKTTSLCSDPTAQTVGSITGTSVQLNWTENGGATSWQIKYGSPGFDPNNAGTQVSVSSKPYTLTGLNPGNTYEWYVRANCAPPANGTSGWAGPATFSTLLSNNNVSGALLLDLDVTYDVSNAGASVETSEPNPGSIGRWGTAANNSVWFKFVAPASGTVTIDTDFLPQGSNNDTQLALYQVGNVSNFSSYTLLVSDDDNGTQGNTYNAVFSYCGLTPGATYYIQADGFSGTAGSFKIMVNESVQAVSLNTTCTAYTTGSVNGVSDPNRWWSLYTTNSGLSVGNLVGAIKTPQNLGTVSLSGRLGSPGLASTNVYYMGRYYNINSSTAPTQAVTVRMFYRDSDLSALQAAIPGQPTLNISNLDALHYDGTNEDCLYSNNGSNTYTTIGNAQGVQVGTTDDFYLEYQVNSFSELLGIVNVSSLPLSLRSFDVVAEKGYNHIYWVTEEESQMRQHTLERSPDGYSAWAAIHTVPAKNGGYTVNRYETNDDAPFYRTFYRLKSEEMGGGMSYSPVVMAIQEAAGLVWTDLYPVPAQESVFLRWNMPQEAQVQFRMWSVTGQLILENIQDAQKGDNLLHLNIGKIPAGMYTLELISGQWQTEKKLLIVN
jgi:hypothetical protein